MSTENQSIVMARKFDKVCSILEEHSYDPNKLITILQAIQTEYRYLPEKILSFVATSLHISPAKVYGVATFYSHFALKPKGKYIIKVCAGTACHVKDSELLVHTVREKLGLNKGEDTTPDMLFTIETVSCLGACGLAPVVVVNEEVFSFMTKEKTRKLIDEIIHKEVKVEEPIS
ncbi:MAG: NAD(P)H-dependent oxidoreductase subunit E [Ignavibacteriae bacterium]|nr:NAD(P)H-dependent oxidoreductase subunit E [Ignavibacteriota bacterium]NOG96352.1 NAD(P)H-dependent oxidoreductase subunit E [Ignavibacteriota bacterium]